MDITEFDRDRTLTNFLSDYIDGNLDRGESLAFEEYLEHHPKEHEFARKALKTQRMLTMLADTFDLAALQNGSRITITTTDIG